MLRYKARVPRVLFIENHDSFSWNVIDALPFARGQIEVLGPAEAWAALDHSEVVVMGPGPTDPMRAGLIDLVREVARRRLPFLGVCLGHQALGLAFGARLVRSAPAHGKRATAHFSNFAGLEGPVEVMRYHSLSLTEVASPLKVMASLADGTVMAIEHESLPMAGVQFHPDSFGTPRGRDLLANWFKRSPLPAQRGESQGEGPLPTPSTPLKLSTLLSRDDFALLGPGFSTHGHWTLLEDLHEGDGALWYASAESKTPTRLAGRATTVEPIFDVPAHPLRPRLDETGFLEGVSTIREHIAAGDVYQVNLTLRAQLDCPTGAALLTTLCRTAVPRFAAWVKTRATGELVSASPELLVETRDRWIHVEPMKGTAPPAQRAWLEASEKDRAELAMITDLLRDDLHRLCVPCSVHVRNERRMIELPYVVQAVADVEGELEAGTTLQQVLDVVHPGGSVTGAPREAALEDIAMLERDPRGAYCGTLGLEADGAARFALLIRTAERRGAGWSYGVGSGITWDSDPHAELDEVRLKLGALGP
ncbi:MAG: chorismate-binding protein [Archangium sp.]|nr:chorismate-binding protein [Archangium sp.]